MEKIILRSLEVWAVVGVPEEERNAAQRLLLDIEIAPNNAFSMMEDRVERTVDYAELANKLSAFCAAHPRKLIETLARECADYIVANFPAKNALVRVKKFVLENADWVAVETFATND